MGVRILTGFLAIIVVLCVCSGAAEAATIGARRTERSAAAEARGSTGDVRAPNSRQNDGDYSDEDSDEDGDQQEFENAQQLYQLQQNREDSFEDSDEEGDDDQDDIYRRRRRRDVDMVIAESAVPDVLNRVEIDKEPETNQTEEQTQDDGKKPEGEEVVATITAAPPSRKSSVLILIRDALKKVTTLPTEQVATNALQYFQLFEHFLQQTIEEVIGAVDDDDEDVTTVKPSIEITPEEPEEVIKEPELVNKLPSAIGKPAEPEIVGESVGSTTVEKPIEPEAVQKPAMPATESLIPSAATTEIKAPDMATVAPSIVEQKPAEI